MAIQNTVISKRYPTAFELDKPKLTRIIEVIEKRAQALGLAAVITFAVELKRGRIFRLSHSDDLLALDNRVLDPLVFLEISASVVDGPLSPTDEMSSVTNEASPLTISIKFASSEYRNVSLVVGSQDANVAAQVFGELEEQIERTFLTSWIYRMMGEDRMFVLLITPLSIPLIGLLWFGESLFGRPTPGLRSLPHTELRGFVEQADTSRTLEQKVDFLFALQRRQLAQANTPEPALLSNIHISHLFVLGPLAVVLCCAIFTIATCYPRAVFNWGDYEAHYTTILRRRSTLWTTVTVGMIVSVLASMFVMGITDGIGQ